eukprot:GHVN01056798.1.p1 GENE.GHVN01056798.1~~GHVN01056798.1.p1  ORF type:complete len:696 (-),score=107.28 GHVN01056798.1:2989-5076(-)
METIDEVTKAMTGQEPDKMIPLAERNEKPLRFAQDSFSNSTLYRFKDITTVPNAKDLVDIVLSKTNRKTPTIIHPQFKIHRIRSFYMRKVKFCAQTLNDKLGTIIKEFPRLEDIHPFYADLCNVLYDRDHFKIALGQLNTIRSVGDRVAKHYVRLLKYADSPYKCKMLKRAALGRLATSMKKLQGSLVYLEEVRQHLSRLPQINPTSRTLILSGYPNVGKSSFMNEVTRSNVEVQPYAFTTRSLYVGHFDYEFTRWQVIDTPGVLDRPIDERNTIEMTAITALVHIQAAILYFLDISEQCGFSIKEQVSLFHSISAAFRGKPLVVVINKIDLRPITDLNDEEKALIETIKKRGEEEDIRGEFSPTSCITQEGIDATKNKACEMLLSQRVEKKVGEGRVERIHNRLFVATPKVGVDANGRSVDRPPCIPQSVIEEKKMRDMGETAQERFVTERDREAVGGGPGVYQHDHNKKYLLADPSWRYDLIPEIYNGKNVADFMDPEIANKMNLLLQEEERLLAQQDPNLFAEDTEYTALMGERGNLHRLIGEKRMVHGLERTRSAARPGKFRGAPVDGEMMKVDLEKVGYDVDSGVMERGRAKRRQLTSASEREASAMSDGSSRGRSKSILTSASHKRGPSRIDLSLPRPEDREKAAKRMVKDLQIIGRLHKKGEADRFIGTARPKHLLSGKRGIGKTQRR